MVPSCQIFASFQLTKRVWCAGSIYLDQRVVESPRVFVGDIGDQQACIPLITLKRPDVTTKLLDNCVHPASWTTVVGLGYENLRVAVRMNSSRLSRAFHPSRPKGTARQTSTRQGEDLSSGSLRSRLRGSQAFTNSLHTGSRRRANGGRDAPTQAQAGAQATATETACVSTPRPVYTVTRPKLTNR